MTGCGLTGTSDIINAAIPASNVALDKLVSETWNSRLPCSWPARAWVERAAMVPGEGQTFQTHCDPMNLIGIGGLQPK